MVMVGYHIGRTNDPDTPALNMLVNILTSGRSSRLYRRLVDTEQLVLGINARPGFSFDPDLLVFGMQIRSGVEPAKAEKSLYEELDKAGATPVSGAEIEKARNSLLASHYRSLKTIAGKANLIGNYEVFLGDWSKLNNVAAEYEKVTAADIQRVAAKYFKPTNRTVGTLIPTGGPAAPRAKEAR
jgi:zinc protease